MILFSKKYLPVLLLILIIVLGKLSDMYLSPEAEVRRYHNDIVKLQEESLKDLQTLQDVFTAEKFDVEKALVELEKNQRNLQQSYDEFLRLKNFPKPEDGKGVTQLETNLRLLHDAMQDYFEIEIRGVEKIHEFLESHKGKDFDLSAKEKLKNLFFELKEQESKARDDFRRIQSIVKFSSRETE